MEIKRNGFKNERLGIELDVYIIKGGEWFRAMDIAKYLDYRDSERFTRTITFEENVSTHNVGSETIKHNETFINEFGLYETLCKITKTNMERYNKAREFQKWVFSEVLPSLRVNNFYVDKNNINEIQVEQLIKEVNVLTQQRNNFSNILMYNKKKKQKLKTFLEDMFKDVEDVYQQFLDNMKDKGSLDENYQPTQLFMDMNKIKDMFEHKTITNTVRVDEFTLTNLGMEELGRRLYIEDGKLKIRK